MSTNKTTPTRDDFNFKQCAKSLQCEDPVKYTALPMCILDIRCGRTGNSFEFISSFKGSISVCDVEALSSEYRIWLLAKFKTNLRKLSVVDELKQWVYSRLLLLREYCDVNSLEFETLYVKSALPPAPYTRLERAGVRNCHTDEHVHYTSSVAIDPTINKKKADCLSADENQKAKKSKLVFSKVQKNRSVLSGLKVLIQKYATQGSIDKETLLSELECLRPHIYDI